MTKTEYSTFVEAMNDLGDNWTEEEISSSSFADMTLEEAIQLRTEELKQFTDTLGTALRYMLNK